MGDTQIKIGDVVKIKKLYWDSGKVGIVVDIQKSESLGEGGWISMDYVIMTSSGNIFHMTETCIEYVIE